jgi:Flp pilus assembly protein TadG
MWTATIVNTLAEAAVLKQFRLFGADGRGVVGIEFALISLTLTLGVLNAVDVGFFIYQRMQVEYAAEAGAQAAWKACNNLSGVQQLPATQNCAGLNTALTAAIQSTSLTNKVSLASGYPTEAYYCTNASDVLQNVGSVSNPAPADCSGAGTASASPGDYIQVQVTYAYTPLFSGLSVMSTIGITSITKTSWMRLG